MYNVSKTAPIPPEATTITTSSSSFPKIPRAAKKRETKKLSSLFVVGELYCLSRKMAKKRFDSYKNSTEPYGNYFIVFPIPSIESSPVFFNFVDNDPFCKPVFIEYDTPMLYLGIEEKWNARIHVFLHGEMKIFTLGIFNSYPNSFWQKV